MNRRNFLAGTSVSLISISGCLYGMPSDAIVHAVSAAQTNAEKAVQYDTLPEEEQLIAETAVEEGLFHTCSDLSGTIRTFSQRFSDSNTEYLWYQNSLYSMYHSDPRRCLRIWNIPTGRRS